MSMPNFVDAFSAIDDIFGKLTPEEETEARYYDILGDISIALVDYRTKHNLNQTQLAKILGVRQSMISKYESGDYNFTLRTLNELCGKLGISLEIRVGVPEEKVESMPLFIPDPDASLESAA